MRISSKNIALVLVAAFMLCAPLAIATSAMAEVTAPQEGAPFPDITFPAPANASELAELGLPAGAKTFKLTDIKAKVVLLEVYSLYCTHCRAEAPHVVKLYELIKEAGLQDSIKMFGLGAKNSRFEVDAFRKQQNIPFPLVADPNMDAYTPLGKPWTPYFCAVQINPDGSTKVFYSKEGGFKDPAAFLEMLKKGGGL